MCKVKSIWIACLLLVLTGSVSQLHAQKLGPPIVLHIQQSLISGNSVKIGFEIPYDGYIEFDLYDQKGNKVWFTSYVREKGTHYQALRKDKLEENVEYSFDFRYKGETYSGKFLNN